MAVQVGGAEAREDQLAGPAADTDHERHPQFVAFRRHPVHVALAGPEKVRL